MKVLIATGIYPPESGGPATYAKLLHDELPKRGIQVEVLPFREVRHLPKLVRHMAYAMMLLRAGRGVDVVYAQDTISVGVPARLANLFLRKKLIVRVPGDHVWEQGTQRYRITDTLDTFPAWSWSWHPVLMVMRILQRWVVRKAEMIIVPSEYVRGIAALRDIDSKKIHTIYSGVAIPVEKINPATLSPSPRIVTVARLVPWKGVSALIDVIAKEEGWQLIIGDDGPLRSELEAKAKHLGVSNRATFVGRLPHAEMMGHIANADLFVLNSTYEGLSHLLVEAMALGVPVVATKVGGNPELIEDGVSGLLVTSGDTAALHAAIKAIVGDPVYAKKIAYSAQVRAQSFSFDKSLAKLVTLLTSL